MSLNAIRTGELETVFRVLEEAFLYCGIDYYLIGALAREVWFAKSEKTFRTTRDVDFAVLVVSQTQYDQVREYLEVQRGYRPAATNAFALITPDGTVIDLLPFGAIEIDDNVILAGERPARITVNGFMEVYKTGTEAVEITEGRVFKVATLPSIVLLKLIAYDDRPDMRSKDANDIANILLHFFELSEDLIYEHHNDLFADEERELEEIASIVAGREIGEMLRGNEILYNRVKGILQALEKVGSSAFIRNMAQETDRSTEEMGVLLSCVLSGLKTNPEPIAGATVDE